MSDSQLPKVKLYSFSGFPVFETQRRNPAESSSIVGNKGEFVVQSDRGYLQIMRADSRSSSFELRTDFRALPDAIIIEGQ